MADEQHRTSMTMAPTASQATSLLPVVSNTPIISANGSTLPSSSGLPSDVLARIEANKQAALQRRRAAENAAKLQRRDGDDVHAILPTAIDLDRQPTNYHIPQSFAQHSGANECRQPAKRHFGALGAVADEDD
jgi:hypothetical protein